MNSAVSAHFMLVTRGLNLVKISILIIFVSAKVYSQGDKPTSVLVNSSYTSKTLALVVRFDKGIDSINFPVDTTLIKMQIKKLDANGMSMSPKKVYYEYRFTAKADTTYKLPSALIWSDNTNYEIPLNQIIKLKRLPGKIKLSSSDSLKLIAQEKAKRIEKYKLEETERLKGKIESRISKKVNKRVVLLWTDKDILKVNDNFRIVIESNRSFDLTDTSNQFLNTLSEKFVIVERLASSIHKNGYENHYKIFVCRALSTGKTTIGPLNLKAGNKRLKTNKWAFSIIE